MSPDRELLDAEELFESAPVGYLTTAPDGTILRVNRAFEALCGRPREALVGRLRLIDLLSPAGRIYFETHYEGILRLHDEVRELAVELPRPDGSRVPVLLNADLHRDADGTPKVVRATAFDASDRRSYERELVKAKEREGEIARRLQRGLLDGALPHTDRLAVEVAYRPAVSGLEIGGDWYDAFWVEDGSSVFLAVGDVVGRGLEAATTMGQLRSAIRALAGTGLEPGAVLRELDAFARRHGVGRMTTVCAARIDLDRRTLEHACAGHPPPALLVPGEAPRLEWDGRSLPIDAFTATSEERPQGVVELAPGSTVLLFTDGLVERRREPLEVGLGRLLAAVDGLEEAPPQELVRRTVRAMRTAEGRDDVCLLAARVA